MRRVFLLAAVVLFASACKQAPAPSGGATTDKASSTKAPATVASLHDITVKDITGKDVALADYKGKVLLVVNVASQCGFTPQYTGLEQLHERYQRRGFAVLGFPSNDFGGQEPGSEAEIAAFGKDKYGVTFPMFELGDVKGPNIIPVFSWLTTQPVSPGEIQWNFEKFLISRKGTLIARFATATDPTDPTLVAAIDAALAESP